MYGPLRSMCEEDGGPDARSITSLTTPLLELDAEPTPSWDINIKSIPSPGTQVTDYDLALGMGTQFVGTRH
jgi:hypothetical protein